MTIRHALPLLALMVATLAGCKGNTSELPPVHVFIDMDFQQKFTAQERNDFFADHRAMRPPVEGTVAQGFLKDDDLFYRGRGFDGRLSDELPEQVELGPALLKRGQQRYDIYCAPCHDNAGHGTGPATRRGGGFKVQPASFHQDRLRPMPLGYFFDVITNGKGTMMPYNVQIPEADRWAIAVWVRALQLHGKNKGWDDTQPSAVVSPAPAAAPAAPETK
jgi:mono/diheme cytochrome c family protein